MSEGIVIKAPENTTMEQMRATIAAFEANPVDPGAPDVPIPASPTADANAKPQEKVALPEPVKTPTAEEKAPPQQPKEAGEKAASEPQKAAEPVKEKKDWEAAYKGLQREFNKKFMETKEAKQPEQVVEKTPEKVVQAPTPDYLQFTPEGKQRIIADLEKDPVESIVKIVETIVGPIKSRLSSEDAQRIELSRLEGLDRLVQEGHDWLHTEDGLRKVEAVFNENPELWNTRDPYRAALGFVKDVPSKAGQRGNAQATGLTPVLGASAAVPPPTSIPAASSGESMESLAQQHQLFMSRGQMDKAREIMEKMDKLHRGY